MALFPSSVSVFTFNVNAKGPTPCTVLTRCSRATAAIYSMGRFLASIALAHLTQIGMPFSCSSVSATAL